MYVEKMINLLFQKILNLMHLNLLIHNEKKKIILKFLKNSLEIILFNILIILVKYNMIKIIINKVKYQLI